MQRPRIGLHVSVAGGLSRLPEKARALDCECFQFFSRSPRGGRALPIPEETARAFRAACRHFGMECYIHAPYTINFASSSSRVSWGSVALVREELERGTQLGARYVMTHLGSAADLGETEALKQVVYRVAAIFDSRKRPSDSRDKLFTTQLLLEISAGAGGVMGDTFEHLAVILNGLGRADVGVCLDTCHLFASGYDIRTPEKINETMRQFKKHLPLTVFRLLHANDSDFGLGEHKDRHTDIGDGQLGMESFRHLLVHPAFQGRNFILETPGADPRRRKDVALFKKLRDDS